MYTRGMFNLAHPNEMKVFFCQGIKQLAEEVENWPGMKK